MQLKGYRLSRAADKDLEKIYDYTLDGFGREQAIQYLTELDDTLKELVRIPEMGRERDEIKSGLRSFPKLSHVIFYRILRDHNKCHALQKRDTYIYKNRWSAFVRRSTNLTLHHLYPVSE